MRPGTDKLLARAERAARAAEAAFDAGVAETAGARAFYAMLYAAKVMLNERGVRLRSHVRIVAALTRSAPSEAPCLAEWLRSALERRRDGDAGELTAEDAARLVEQALEVVAGVRAGVEHGLREV
jgi:uncharacterized protein (UPF0332 family)